VTERRSWRAARGRGSFSTSRCNGATYSVSRNRSRLIGDLEQLRGSLDSRTALLLGGYAAFQDRERRKSIGAQVVDSLDEFRASLNRLTGAGLILLTERLARAGQSFVPSRPARGGSLSGTPANLSTCRPSTWRRLSPLNFRAVGTARTD